MRPVAVALAFPLALLACKKSGSSPSEKAALAPGFEGDVTMHLTRADAAPMDVVFHIKGSRTRVDLPTKSGEAAHVVFDAASQKTTIDNDAKREFLEVDHVAWARAPGPKMLPARIDETATHETVAGTDCVDWEIVEAAGAHAKVCVAPGVSFFDITSSRPTTIGMPPRNWMDELRLKRAFPLRAVETDPSGKETSRMEVTKIEKGAVDDAIFAPPAGYKEAQAPHPGQFLLPAAPKPQ
jgi:hypothetical protein